MPRSPASSQVGGRNAEGGGAQLLDVGQKPPEEPPPTEEDDDEDDEDRVLEISSKWQKLNQQVTRDVPGIDAAYLAMDTEEGVEVVWNEVRYSHRRMVKGRRERLIKILGGLTQVKHQNIVNFYDFWHDKVNQQDRLVFITEYITSGSLLTFLMKTKTTKSSNAVSDKIWRRWCRHILMALSYLHKNEIIHGNLSLASIFIQHNGLVKIGSVSPDAIHRHVKTKNEETTDMHYAAPEIADGPIKTPADIYAFGMCALEMLNFELLGNGDGAHGHTSPKQEAVLRAVEGLHKKKREFIELCLHRDPDMRPRAQSLLKHPVLQEVYPLKLLAAYALRDSKEIETLKDKLDYSDNPDLELAHISRRQGAVVRRACDIARIDIEKLYDDISQDFLLDSSIPMYSPQKKDDSVTRSLPQSSSSATDRNSSTFYEPETRRVIRIDCDVHPMEGDKKELVLKLHLDSKMERMLKSEINDEDRGADLAMDLVTNGLLAEVDRKEVTEKIDKKLCQLYESNPPQPPPSSPISVAN